MVKDFMWHHFEKTGEINAYLCFRECVSEGKPKEYDNNTDN